jgi:hypothetical protein
MRANGIDTSSDEEPAVGRAEAGDRTVDLRN